MITLLSLLMFLSTPRTIKLEVLGYGCLLGTDAEHLPKD